jgi:hypothetical protein
MGCGIMLVKRRTCASALILFDERVRTSKQCFFCFLWNFTIFCQKNWKEIDFLFSYEYPTVEPLLITGWFLNNWPTLFLTSMQSPTRVLLCRLSKNQLSFKIHHFCEWFFRTAHEGSHIPDPYPWVSSFFERKERNTKHQFLCLKILGLPKFPWGFQLLIIRQPMSFLSTACGSRFLPGREGVLDFLLDFFASQNDGMQIFVIQCNSPTTPLLLSVLRGAAVRRFREFV